MDTVPRFKINEHLLPDEIKAHPYWTVFVRDLGTGDKKPSPTNKFPHYAEGAKLQRLSNHGGYATSKCYPLPQAVQVFDSGLTNKDGFTPNSMGPYFSADTELVCIDLDRSVQADGRLHPWAVEILEWQARTYTELSASGYGHHLIGKVSMAFKQAFIEANGGKLKRQFDPRTVGGVDGKASVIDVFVATQGVALTTHVLEGSACAVADLEPLVTMLTERYSHKVGRPPQGAKNGKTVLADDAILWHVFQHETYGDLFRNMQQTPLPDTTDETEVREFDPEMEPDQQFNASVVEATLAKELLYYASGDRAKAEALFWGRFAERAKWSANPQYVTRTFNWAEATLGGYVYVRNAKLLAQVSQHLSKDPVDVSAVPNPLGIDGYTAEQLFSILGTESSTASFVSDDAIGLRALQSIGDQLLYSGGRWHYRSADAVVWSEDDKSASTAIHKVKDVAWKLNDEARQLLHIAAALVQAGREHAGRAMLKAAHAVEKAIEDVGNYPRQERLIRSVRHARTVDPNVFASKPLTLPLSNGITEGGIFRPYTRDDYIFNPSAVGYYPDTPMADFKAFLHRATGGDAEVQDALQIACAIMLSNSSKYRFLLWLCGAPGTGKSTIQELISTVAGDSEHGKMAGISPNQLRATEDRSRLGYVLFNKTVAVISEAGGAAKLSNETLKTLTGGDRLNARGLYREQFSFTPTHNLMAVSNDLPDLNGYDPALQKRLWVFRFTHTLDREGKNDLLDGVYIEDARQDPNSNLTRGFLLWVLEGHRRLAQMQKVEKPPLVASATQSFMDELSEAREFWSSPLLHNSQEYKEFCKESMIGVRKIKSVYDMWCAFKRQPVIKEGAFKEVCFSAGLAQYKAGNGPRSLKLYVQDRQRFEMLVYSGQDAE